MSAPHAAGKAGREKRASLLFSLQEEYRKIDLQMYLIEFWFLKQPGYFYYKTALFLIALILSKNSFTTGLISQSFGF